MRLKYRTCAAHIRQWSIFFFCCLCLWVGVFDALAVSLGDRVAANGTVNVRPSPAGTPVSGQQSSGSLGVVIGGPQTATLSGTSYTWYDVNFDTGVDGWVADSGSAIGLTVVTPATPSSPSPGTSSSPGPTQASSTVTLSWGATTGATYYDLGVVDVATGSFVVNTTTTSTSYPVTLTAGKTYKWNVAAADSAGDGTFTTVLYFQTPSATVTPSITSVNPASPIGSNSTQPFTINGNNFVSGCTVTLRDLTDNQTFANRTISSQTSSQIVINPDFTTAADNWSVEVINPGNASSGQYDFTITPPTVTPSITSVSPASPIGSNSTQPFTINGNNFVSGCTVTLRDLTDNQTFANRTISSQTSGQIVINPDFTTAADNWSVEVINPGNASSGQYDFTITPPTVMPSITSVNPAVPIGSNSQQPFTINGNNFVSGCTVTLRDLTDNQTFANRTIGSFSSTAITINPDFTTAADLWSVEIINPGSVSSGQFQFNVQAPTVTTSTFQGADFNANAKNFNWSQEVSGSPSFLIIKASQGGNINSFLPSDMSSVPAISSSFTFGCYDYADPDEVYGNEASSTTVTDPSNSGQVIADAHAAANVYYQIAGPYLTSGHLAPALDLEDDEGYGGFDASWTWSEIAEWIAAWTTQLQQDNSSLPAPILYMTQYYAENISPQLINNYLSSSVFYRLWIADINNSPNVDPNPSIGSWPTWTIEQYDWSEPLPPGDLDAMNSSIALTSLEIQTQTTGGGSTPIISNAKLTGSTFTLSVPTQTGTNYVLEYKNSMSDANWIPIQTNSGTGGMMNLTNTGTFGPSRFYRIRLQ